MVNNNKKKSKNKVGWCDYNDGDFAIRPFAV